MHYVTTKMVYFMPLPREWLFLYPRWSEIYTHRSEVADRQPRFKAANQSFAWVQ